MITVSARTTLFASDSEVAAVVGVSIPDWNEVQGARLLRSVDYYEDAAFNYHLLGDLLEELDSWRTYEDRRDDPHARVDKINEIAEVSRRALETCGYIVFLSL